jgi:hypothetical protein
VAVAHRQFTVVHPLGAATPPLSPNAAFGERTVSK